MIDAPRTRALTAARCSCALLVAGALVLAGCGSAEDTGGSDAATSSPGVAAAPVTPGAATTAGGGEAVGAVTDALEASREAGSGRVEATTQASTGQRVSASTTSGVFSDTALKFEITTQVPGRGESSLEVRQVDGSVYLYGVPGLAEEQWIQAPLEDLGAAIGAAGGNNPFQRLALLEQVTDDVERVGQEEVGGVEATHYAGSIDLEGAKRELSEQQGGGGNAAQLQQLGLSTIPFDLHVGPEGLPVRMVTTFEVNTQGVTSTATFTADFSNWGTEVDVEVPKGAVPISETVPSVPTATPSS